MSFESLNRVIRQLRQTHWQEQQAFQRLLDEWPQLVGPAVSAQTQPLRLTQKRVLQVATSSGVWAHNLSFERQNLIKKLNDRFNLDIVDIFFSSSQWGRSPLHGFLPDRAEAADLTVQEKSPPSNSLLPRDAREAFEQWAKAVQARSRSLPDCPCCHCPTPPMELDRWGCCGLCEARKSLENPDLRPL
ncbi:DUF721 domain-containing protein [Lyngbya confervoides]|uniref:DUF721 domain-containing protein n=1 Tax=Lyngbya confervoides BDU141951 TaxID=1574623 RepID=A0ABD4T5Y1_9CYAN|nr:DUF721 domain-containing protein [Lyngbya confervoides]MCM1983682.1 DUF721 domain-containing protein [Lyngbya confervoides BDU141951]